MAERPSSEYRLFLDGAPTEIERFDATSDAEACLKVDRDAAAWEGNELVLMKVIDRWTED